MFPRGNLETVMSSSISSTTPLIEEEDATIVPPEIIIFSGQKFVTSYAAFFASIHNEKTEESYSRALINFFRYLKRKSITDLNTVDAPRMALYLKALKRRKNKKGKPIALATIAIEISAIRMFFKSCVNNGALVASPAAEIHPPKLRRTTGATPVIVPEMVRLILNTIPDKTQANYRDKALIAIMTFTFYRISATLSMQVKDYYLIGDERWVKAKEKGSKIHKMPVHPDLREIMDQYIVEADLEGKREALLFPSSHGKSGRLNGKPYSRTAAWKMVNRHARRAGYHDEIGNHSFRASGITQYMNMGGSLKQARKLAGHSHISTTMLYDRSEDLEKSKEIARLKF
ncbi:MAG: hypothetical protein COA43_00830 [Robiginitomaculum sp.]|nr:MAG: hypothetical protein COA43_00830 [Robiginitomaculum sp.]